jgi:NAD(P)-dependent dehydrogenase (short-subunit alcohol dehydrogenase family)
VERPVDGRVAGKRVLITGAARGLGPSHAVRLAGEGAALILVDICQSLPQLEYPLATEEDLAETAQLVRNLGRRCVSRVADVRDEEQLRSAVDDGVTELGGLDGAVANAGAPRAFRYSRPTPRPSTALSASRWRWPTNWRQRMCASILRFRPVPIPG